MFKVLTSFTGHTALSNYAKFIDMMFMFKNACLKHVFMLEKKKNVVRDTGYSSFLLLPV